MPSTFTQLRCLCTAICIAVCSAAPATGVGTRIVAAARAQIGVTTRYIPDYKSIAYPGGDVPRNGGVCTDVVIRALRDALGIDLQKRVHEDMKAHFSRYPHNWNRRSPDSNIDHRRVPNLRLFFKRAGWEVNAHEPCEPGDLVSCILPGGKTHIMIVSDHLNAKRQFLVIHNIGRGAVEEDCLRSFTVTGHYRVRT